MHHAIGKFGQTVFKLLAFELLDNFSGIIRISLGNPNFLQVFCVHNYIGFDLVVAFD